MTLWTGYPAAVTWRSGIALNGRGIVLLAVVGLLVLRACQLLGVGPLLFDWEFVQFGSLALEVEAGTRQLSELWRRPEAWTYMEHAQGTILPIGGTALLVPWFGANIWTLHATSVLPEALTLGLLLVLLWRRSGSVRVILLAAFAWACVPRGAAVWQMLPFGNHTEFLWVPLAVALLLDLRPRSSAGSGLVAGLIVLLLGLGFVAYRGTLASGGALILALTLTHGADGFRRAAAIGVAASCLALWVLHTLTDPQQWEGLRTLRELLVGAPVMDPSSWGDRIGRLPQRLPSAPAAVVSPWPYLGLVTCVGLITAVQLVRSAAPQPIARGIAAPAGTSGRPASLLFLVLWLLASLTMTLAADARYDQYFLQPFYGLLVCALVAPTLVEPGSLLRRLALLGVLSLGLLGVPDNAELLRPSAWEANRSYRGLALWGQFQMTSMDEDDIPYWDRLAGRADLRHFVGQGFPPNDRCGSNLRVGGKLPIPDPGTNRCSCWAEGTLATFVKQRLSEDPQVPLEQLGMGAWIGCNRDEASLSAALEGLGPTLKGRIWAGARALD